MKKIVLILITLIFINLGYTQNYLANPSFEAVNNCVEYHADCAPEAWFNIPATNYGVALKSLLKPVYGESILYLPIGSVLENFNIPRFIYSAICCPLKANEKYIVSFYIAGTTVAFDSIAMYFTSKEPTLFSKKVFNPSSCIKLTKANVDDIYKDKWMHIKYEFIATGNEKFITFTTLGLQQKNYDIKLSMNKSGDIFYFIDEIILKPLQPLELCKEYKSNEDKLFNQNYRHTDNITIYKEEETKPTYIVKKDTVVISDLLFSFGKYTLTLPVQKKLDSLFINLDSNKVQQIEIIGHTDSVGNLQKNTVLSINRAKSISEYVSKKYMPFSKVLIVTGKGALQPKASNTNSRGRQQNRRVEIVFTRLINIDIKNK